MESIFSPFSPEQLNDNLFKLIGSDWMLITAGNADSFNTMTASWGTAGILWNKPVAVCFIRPERYTYEFVEKQTHLSLSFLPDTYRKALSYCGSHSGREGDKLAACGLRGAVSPDGVPYIKEARIVLQCRKLYVDDLRHANFLDPALLTHYEKGGFHRFYVCEIEKILRAE
jgi:flavin reductase (DIM6/NTAB) family NADH-FMN oxidoreductase RutF